MIHQNSNLKQKLFKSFIIIISFLKPSKRLKYLKPYVSIW